MPLTSQQKADLLLAHWRLLWPLPPSERIKKIEEIELDYNFEEQLGFVAKEMEEAQ
jgi:hypothetical protein